MATKPNLQPVPTMPRAVLFGIAAATFTQRTPMELALSYRGLSEADICRTINLKREGKFDYSCLLVPLESGKTSWSSDKRGITAMLNKVEDGTLTLAEVVTYLKAGIDIEQKGAEQAASGAFTEQEPVEVKKAAPKAKAPKKPAKLKVAPAPTPEVEVASRVARGAAAEAPSTSVAIDIDALTDTFDAIVLRRLNDAVATLQDRMPVSNDAAVLRLQEDVDDLRSAVNGLGRMVVAVNENLITYADIIIPGAEDHLAKISFEVTPEDDSPSPGWVAEESQVDVAGLPKLPESAAHSSTAAVDAEDEVYSLESLEAMDEVKLRKVAAQLGIVGSADSYPAVLIHKISRLHA